MHPKLTHITAQQHIADLHRAADHNRLVHTATTPTTPPRQQRTPPPRQSRSCAGSEAAWHNAPVARERQLEAGQGQARKRHAGSAAALPLEA